MGLILKTLEDVHVKNILLLQKNILNNINNPEIFNPDDAEMVQRCINGFSCGFFDGDLLIAYLLIFFPKTIDECYSLYTKIKVNPMETAHFETVVVSKEYRNRSLQYKLFIEGLKCLNSTEIKHLFSIASPENIYSIKNLHKSGFEEICCLRIFNNKRRIIFYRKLY